MNCFLQVSTLTSVPHMTKFGAAASPVAEAGSSSLLVDAYLKLPDDGNRTFGKLPMSVPLVEVDMLIMLIVNVLTTRMNARVVSRSMYE